MGRFSEQDARRAWTRLSAWYRLWLEYTEQNGDTPGHKATLARARDALGDARVVRQMLDQAELGAVKAARGTGASWIEIGVLLGTSEEAAQEKWRGVDGA